MRHFMALVCLLSLATEGLRADDKVEKLIQQLAGPRFADREKAAKELVAIGEPALRRLRSASKDGDREVARLATECIRIIETNKLVADLMTQLKSDDAKKRAAAADGLREIGPEAEAAVPALVAALEDSDKHVQLRAVVAIKFIGANAPKAIPRLTAIVANRQSDEDLRFWAMEALEKIGPVAKTAVPVLLEVMEKEPALLRWTATRALGSVGVDDERALPALVKALEDPDLQVQANAAEALGLIGKEPETCIPAILRALKKQGVSPWRGGIIRGLAKYGPQAKKGVVPLLEIMKEKDKDLQMEAIRGLSQIDMDVLVKAVSPILRDEKFDEAFRIAIVKEFRRMGPGARAAIPLLKELLTTGIDTDAIRALDAIDKDW